MGSHRAPEQEQPRGRTTPDEALIRNNRVILIGINTVVAVVFATTSAGTSPGLGILRVAAPLPVWALGGYLLVAVGIVVGFHVAAHFWAIILWFCLAAALTVGAATGASTSPAASLTFAALACMVVALHVNALLYRRALQRQ